MHGQALQQLKRRHHFDEWRGRNTLREALFVHNFLPRDGQLPGFRLERLQQVPADNDQVSYQSMWKDAAGDPGILVRMDVHPCESRMAAHELMARLLGGFQSPAIERRDALTLGDVCFAGPGEAAIVFARANLTVFVARAGAKSVSVLELARHLDRYLADRPSESAAGPAAAVTRTAKSAVSGMKMGTRKVLDMHLDLAARAGSRPFAKLFATGGEVTLEKGRLTFSPDRPGRAHVDTFIIGDDGTVTSRQLALNVE